TIGWPRRDSGKPSGLMYDKILKMNSPVNWTQEADKAFCNIKQVLVSSTALALPDYSKPFVQMVDFEQHGDKMKPVAYFSSKLNGVACVLPHCVRKPIAASMAVEVSATIIYFESKDCTNQTMIIFLNQRSYFLYQPRFT
uniref:Reverse transcriptase/retrotransposon-derived protein RNase H-like domain-containing protein n=1 Tax=Oryzias latipes TaxID=8090 RepID=A0A3P9LZI1_ORYLA